MIDAKKDTNHEARLGASHKIGCKRKIALIFISQKKGEDKEKIELVAGSKVEKMSTIIKVKYFNV